MRPVQTEETLPGGVIVIPDEARAKFASHQVEVVAVGKPEICTDEDCGALHVGSTDRPAPLFGKQWRSVLSGRRLMFGQEFMDGRDDTVFAHPVPRGLEPGAWAIVQPRSFLPAAPDGQKLYFVRQRDVLAVFNDET